MNQRATRKNKDYHKNQMERY